MPLVLLVLIVLHSTIGTISITVVPLLSHPKPDLEKNGNVTR